MKLRGVVLISGFSKKKKKKRGESLARNRENRVLCWEERICNCRFVDLLCFLIFLLVPFFFFLFLIHFTLIFVAIIVFFLFIFMINVVCFYQRWNGVV